jgi:type IV pilus assembly protein PilC
VTVALLRFSRWVANDYGWTFVMLLPIALVMLALAESLRQMLRTPRAEPDESQPLSERLLEMLPSPLGMLHRDRALADACQVIADALSAGQTLETAIEESRQVSGSSGLRRRIDQWLSGIRRGLTPTAAARAARISDLVSGTVAAAQVGGRLDEGMAFLARYYAAKFSRTVLLVRGAFGPAQALVLGALVLFIVLALFMPMLRLIETVTQTVGL